MKLSENLRRYGEGIALVLGGLVFGAIALLERQALPALCAGPMIAIGVAALAVPRRKRS